MDMHWIRSCNSTLIKNIQIGMSGLIHGFNSFHMDDCSDQTLLRNHWIVMLWNAVPSRQNPLQAALNVLLNFQFCEFFRLLDLVFFVVSTVLKALVVKW